MQGTQHTHTGVVGAIWVDETTADLAGGTKIVDCYGRPAVAIDNSLGKMTPKTDDANPNNLET